MSRKLVHTVVSITGTESFKVYRDSETQEYVVRTYRNGVLYEPADSFHSYSSATAKDAKADAIREADFFAQGLFWQRLAEFLRKVSYFISDLIHAVNQIYHGGIVEKFDESYWHKDFFMWRSGKVFGIVHLTFDERGYMIGWLKAKQIHLSVMESDGPLFQD